MAGLKFANGDNISGILFTKFDTLGNPYLTKVLQHKEDELYLLNSPRSRNLIRLSDNSGYLFMASRSPGFANLFIKLDNDGEVVWEMEHVDSTSNADFITSIIEVEDGFMLAGRMQWESNLNRDPIIIKISKDGKFLWRKTFGTFQNDELGMGIIQITPDSFALFGNYGIGIQNGSPGGFIAIIDGAGTELSRWKGPINIKDCCVEDLHIDNKGRYVHISRKMEAEGNRLKKMQPIFIIRDSMFNVLHQHEYADTIGVSHFERITPVEEGGWVAVGRRTAPTSSQIRNRYAWIMRLDEEGKEIWSTEAALFPDSLPVRFMSQDLNQVVELSSGSIVASGNFEWRFGLREERAFLLKVDKNGCWDTIPCRPLTSATEIGLRKDEVLVYPNPASDAFTVHFSDLQSVDIQLYNGSGQLVLAQDNVQSGEQIDISFSAVTEGLYFYHFRNEKNAVIHTGKLIVQ